MKKVMLDTNAYARLMVGDENVLTALGEADTVFMSIFVLGELLSGFRAGNREQRNRSQLREFLQKTTVRILQGTEDTAEIYAGLKHQLKAAGAMLPINDVWIAAHAMESGSQLITFDSHFASVPGLLR